MSEPSNAPLSTQHNIPPQIKEESDSKEWFQSSTNSLSLPPEIDIKAEAFFCAICNESPEDGDSFCQHVKSEQSADSAEHGVDERSSIAETSAGSSTPLLSAAELLYFSQTSAIHNPAVNPPSNRGHVPNGPLNISSSGDNVSYSCELCQCVFTSKQYLSTHMRTHKGEKRFCCNFCQRKFAYKSVLTNHLRLHTGEKPYCCEVCQRTFTTRSALVSHERRHKGDKRFSCDVCGKKFVATCDLNAHTRTHTGEKPFKCEECGRAYPDRRGLNKHKKVHSDEMPFSCNLACGQTFACQPSHALHMRMHEILCNQDNTYSCPECPRTFSSKYSVARHLLRKHGKLDCKDQDCRSCLKGLNLKV